MKKPQPEPVHVISLGAGVQSSAMALMAAKGELTPMPAFAVFSDTRGEPSAVYRWLDRLERELPFPVLRVSAGDLAADTLAPISPKSGGADYIRSRIPAYVENPDGSKGMLLRQCTFDYKLVPIRRAIRAHLKEVGARRAVSWVGISVDEAMRMKPSGVLYFENRFPLIEAGLSRTACATWLERSGLGVPPKSACTYCPYHSDFQWLQLKQSEPDKFEEAARFEERWNEVVQQDQRKTQIRGRIFLHRSLVPLREVTFRGDGSDGQLDIFGAECEGMCGV